MSSLCRLRAFRVDKYKVENINSHRLGLHGGGTQSFSPITDTLGTRRVGSRIRLATRWFARYSTLSPLRSVSRSLARERGDTREGEKKEENVEDPGIPLSFVTVRGCSGSVALTHTGICEIP